MTNDDEIRVIIGASSQDCPGWIRTQKEELDLTRRSDWEARFRPGSISRVLAEHVWEHLDLGEARVAAGICFDFLRPGGFIRCTVPDGLFPDQGYQRVVQVGGPGSVDHPAAGHKVVYDYRPLPALFAAAGFEVRLLEWWDAEGEFHAEIWDERKGFVYRSARFDHRNRDGRYGFTSLIVDAVKPVMTG
jgi:predicted SAM-dependent methyltransferase